MMGSPKQRLTPEQFVANDGLGALVGARFVSLNDGVCVYEYEPRAAHHNPGGMLHGGALYTVMDSSQGMLVYSLVQPPTVAASGTATIKYLAPVRHGRIVVTTTLAKSEGRKLFVHSEAVDEAGVMVAVLDEIWIELRAA
jgi:acyl-CoA thioesterase